MELLAVIARVRRAMPRNEDVMAICDAAEKALIAKPAKPAKSLAQLSSGASVKTDRKAYMRAYMAKRRRYAAGKA